MDFRPLHATIYKDRGLNAANIKLLLLVIDDTWQRVSDISSKSGYGMPRTKHNLNYLVKAGLVELKRDRVQTIRGSYETALYRLMQTSEE